MVCKTCFKNTFGGSDRFITDGLQNKILSVSGIAHDDLKGKSAPANKIAEEDMNS